MPPAHLARRFVLVGLMLLLTACLLLSWLAVYQLRDIALQEAQARARLVAEEMANQVQLAVDVGVPVDRLVGVEALFEHRMTSFPGIVRATLRDTEGRVLHERQTSGTSSLAPATLPVVHAGATVATLELQWRLPTLKVLLLPWGIPLVALIAVATGLAGEALRFALTGLVLRRERVVRASCQRIAAGDLATRAPSLGRRDFDSRLPWLAEQLRHVREQHMRVERLAQSLRQTEPDFEKRRQLDQMLVDALGDNQFAGQSAPQTDAMPQMPASSQAAMQRWRGVKLGLLAWAPVAALAGYHFVWVGLGALILLTLVLGCAKRMRWWLGTASGWYGTILGGLVFGPCLSLLVQMAWVQPHFRALGDFGYAVLTLMAIAALILPWFGNLEQEPLPGKAHHAA